ncbi:Mucin-associated surface protein (MASP), subgroup S100 [Trypanosoma cruzi]|nr:Mucin-associated surface protein (MASP), subgroup S100 [Trypanosoma cruzi]KAF8307071.1 Mucin-associated surface protein (MASP), subgroup S100 [Trypanosoma cruzi]
MVMMVTGRVLLVCALCVLWCGAVFGHAMEDYCGEGGGNGLRHTSNGGDDGVSLKADCGLLSTRMGLIKAVEAADAGENELSVPGPSQDTGESLPNNTEGSAAAGPGGDDVAIPPATAVPLGSGGSDTKGQKEKPGVLDPNGEEHTDNKKKRTEPHLETPRTDQSSSSSSSGSPDTKSGNDANLENNSERNESSDETPTEEEEEHINKSDSREVVLKEEQINEIQELRKGKISHEAPTETRGSPANDAEIQTATPSPPPVTINEHSNTETLRPIQLPQHVQDDNAESRPPSPTANGDAANNEADKSTEDGIPSNDPAADGAGTREEKQNENKDANPKETPATAMKNTTATTGDSDGSTAVSHTTSPLLLLVVVACAAAAAVLAA